MIWQARNTAKGASSVRLHDHSVTGNHRRRDLQRHQHHRDVPWNDGTDDAKRLAHSECQHVGAERNGLALELRTEPAEERKYVRESRSLYSALGAQRLAGLERNEPAEFLDVFVEYAAAFHDQFSALASRQFRPCFLCVRGGLHRGVDIGGVTLGGLSDHGAGRRVDVRKRPAATRRHEGAADQQLARKLPSKGAWIEFRFEAIVLHDLSLCRVQSAT